MASVAGVGTPGLVRRVPVVPVVVPAVLAVATYALVRPALIDDAYISFRYADQLVRGRGYVFNAGERVEGATNALWTLLLAIPHAVGLSIVAAASVFGLLSVIGATVLTTVLGRRLGLEPVIALACGCAVAISAQFVASGTMGLEGGLFSALIVLCLLSLTRPRSWTVGTVCLLLGATRPEGLVIAVVLLALLVGFGSDPIRERLRVAAAGLAGVAVVELVRLVYFDALVPNSVTAKRDIGYSLFSSLRYHARDGLDYLRHGFGLTIGTMILVGLATAVVSVNRAKNGWRPPRPHLLPVALVAVGALGMSLPVLSGGDWMPYSRMLMPYLPVLVLGAALLASYIVEHQSPVLRKAIPIAVVLSIGLLGPHPNTLRDGGANPISTDRPFDALGRALNEIGTHERVVASDVLGRVSFYAPDVRFVDPLSLIDSTAASRPGRGSVYGKRSTDAIVARRPIVVASNDWVGLEQIVRDPRARGQRFEIVTDDRMTGDHLLIAAEPAMAEQLATVLRSRYPDVEVLPLDDGLARWRARFPHGQ
jgi:hypothetical protein